MAAHDAMIPAMVYTPIRLYRMMHIAVQQVGMAAQAHDHAHTQAQLEAACASWNVASGCKPFKTPRSRLSCGSESCCHVPLFAVVWNLFSSLTPIFFGLGSEVEGPGSEAGHHFFLAMLKQEL